MIRLFFLPIPVPIDLLIFLVYSPFLSFSFFGFLLTFTGSVCPNKKELKGTFLPVHHSGRGMERGATLRCGPQRGGADRRTVLSSAL